MCTGGVYRPCLHDRHFSAASSFQIGVSRGRRIRVERDAHAGLAEFAHDEGAVTTITFAHDGPGLSCGVRSGKEDRFYGPEGVS
jgi:hypothetical protein